jgi:hypothetical protein
MIAECTTRQNDYRAATSYQLRYDGQSIAVSQGYRECIHKIYDRGLAASSVLFRFTPLTGSTN